MKFKNDEPDQNDFENYYLLLHYAGLPKPTWLLRVVDLSFFYKSRLHVWQQEQKKK